MYQAGKLERNSQSASPRAPRRDSSQAALAADYRFSPVAQVALDRNGCIRRINVAAAVLLKGDLFQLTDIPFIAFVDKAYCRLFLDHLAQATSAPKKICTRLVLSSATRAIGPVELQSTSNVDSVSGSLFCRTAIVMLSPDRRAVPSSSESDQYPYQGWLELFPDVAVLEIGGKIISANPSAWRLLGASSVDEIQGQDLFARIHPDSHRSVRDRVVRLPKGKSESSGGRFKDRKGKDRTDRIL
jgi:PAS domain-containing protein